MRITMVTRIFEPEPAAASQRLGAVARELAARGHQVTVLTSEPPLPLRAAGDTDRGYEVRRNPVLRDRAGYLRGYLPYLSFDIPAFFRLLFVPRPSVVLVEPPPTTGIVVRVVCALRRIPYVYYAADVWSDAVDAMGGSGAVSGILRFVESRAMRGAKRVLSVSRGVTARVEELGTANDRIVTLGNGVDTATFSPDTTPERPDHPYFVYTGTMSEWQRPTIFIEALERLSESHPNVRLRFFGQGSEEDALRAEAERVAPGRVIFGRVVPPAAAAGWIRGAVAALVSVVPGQGYDLARPTKTYAAAACGTPVIFAGPAEAGEFIRDAALGSATAFDAGAVAEAMRTALDDWSNGATEEHRAARVAWAREHASLETIARAAAEAIEASARKEKRR